MKVNRRSLTNQFREIGIHPGDTLMVHSSVRAIGPVIGGAAEVVEALLEAIGVEGTLAAYVDFEPFYEDDDVDVPVFNKLTACAARDHGVLHEVIRTWPGAIRSDHPDAGVVAIGSRAAFITADHPFQYGYGPGSPLEKLYGLNAKILMLGAPLDTITMLHYAEHMAQIEGKRLVRYRRLMPTAEGSRWIDFEEFDTSEPVVDWLPENCFELIARDFLAGGQGRSLQIGAASSYLFEGSELIPYAIGWLERFSHDG